MLEDIMNKQNALQKALGIDFDSMTEEQRVDFMRMHRGFLEDELSEALYEMPMYKPWKDYSNMTEEEKEDAWSKVKLELIDALHFFVNLLLCTGMSASDVYDMYCAKNAENYRRQEAGYTSNVSYRDQEVGDVLYAYAEPCIRAPKPDSPNSCSVSLNNTLAYSEQFMAATYEDTNEGVSESLFLNSTVENMYKTMQHIRAILEHNLKNMDEEIRKDLITQANEIYEQTKKELESNEQN